LMFSGCVFCRNDSRFRAGAAVTCSRLWRRSAVPFASVGVRPYFAQNSNSFNPLTIPRFHDSVVP